MFLQLHPYPVLIDEVQYAPELFSFIKMSVDRRAPPGSYWLTASQSFTLMKLARESLAGRVALLNMSALSRAEIYGCPQRLPFDLDLTALDERLRQSDTAAFTPQQIYNQIWQGGLPGLLSGRYTNRDIFYGSYLTTYLSRDVADLIPAVDKLGFTDFIRAAACRCAQLLNVHDLAKDVGISDDTAKRWLSVLETSEVVDYYRSILPTYSR